MPQRAPARRATAPARRPPARQPWTAAAARLALLIGAACSAAGCQHRARAEHAAFAHLGLTFTYPGSVEAPAPVMVAPLLGRMQDAGGARIAADGASRARAGVTPGRERAADAMLLPYHVELRARDGSARLEVYIDRQPPQPRVALALARGMRHGASLELAEAHTETIAGRRWWRTRFSYAQQGQRAAGIEHATVAAGRLYRVTAHGAPGDAARLAAQVAPALRVVASRAGDPVDQEDPAGSPAPPAAVDRAAEAVVAVVAADWLAMAPGYVGTLRPAAMGSGVTVDADGRVLTSFHTLHDEGRDALHDLFLVARQHPDTGALVFSCAGRPEHGRLHRELDLAMIQCELDMNGRPVTPAGWPVLGMEPRREIAPGEPLWVIGHAEDGDGARSARPGQVTGWTGANGARGRTFLTTDARIVPGLSGGAAVDRRGALIGVVAGFRDRFRANATDVRRIGRVGLLRPAGQVHTLVRAPGAGHAGP